MCAHTIDQALADGSRDVGWKEVLAGLTAAAKNATQPLVEVLLAWRKAGLAQAQQLGSDFGPPSGLVLRRRVGLPAWAVGFAAYLCAQLLRCPRFSCEWRLPDQRRNELTMRVLAVDQQDPLNICHCLAQLAVEAIFLEAALAVVQQGADKLTERQAAALEGLAFDWIVNAERYIEPRFQELVKIRETLVRACVRTAWCQCSRSAAEMSAQHCSYTWP